MQSHCPLVFALFLASLDLQHVLAFTVPEPYVAWTMDNYTDTALIPQYRNEARFQSQYKKLGQDSYFESGVVGQALLVDNGEFVIIENIGSSDCIKKLEVCDAGLSITFWLKVDRWNSKIFQVIFRSTTVTRTLPGVYFGRLDNDQNIIIYFRMENGKAAEALISSALVDQVWSHVGIVWEKSSNELNVYINGSSLSRDQYILAPATSVEKFKAAILTDMVVGSTIGPKFLLDEFYIFYRVITPDQARYMYNGETAAEITTAVMSTAAPSTTQKSTAAPTTTTAQTTTPPITTVEPSTTGKTAQTTTPPITTVEPSTTGKTAHTTTPPMTSVEPNTAKNTAHTTTTTKTTPPLGLSTSYILLATLLPVAILLLCLACFLCVCFARRKKNRKDRKFPPIIPVTYIAGNKDEDSNQGAVESDAADSANEESKVFFPSSSRDH